MPKRWFRRPFCAGTKNWGSSRRARISGRGSIASRRTMRLTACAGGKKKTHAEKLRKQMEQALAALSEAERTAFVMRHWEGCGIEEIAAVLKSSSNATKNTVFRAVQKLRVALQPVVQTRAQARAMGTES